MEQPQLFGPRLLSVTELTRYMRALMDSAEILRDIWVSGELSNLSQPSSGHIYFSLKDQTATLRCVIWRTTAMRMLVNLRNGQAVEAHGASAPLGPRGALPAGPQPPNPSPSPAPWHPYSCPRAGPAGYSQHAYQPLPAGR